MNDELANLEGFEHLPPAIPKGSSCRRFKGLEEGSLAILIAKANAKILSGSSFQVSHLKLFRAVLAHDRRPHQLDQSLEEKLPSECGGYRAN